MFHRLVLFYFLLDCLRAHGESDRTFLLLYWMRTVLNCLRYKQYHYRSNTSSLRIRSVFYMRIQNAICSTIRTIQLWILSIFVSFKRFFFHSMCIQRGNFHWFPYRIFSRSVSFKNHFSVHSEQCNSLDVYGQWVCMCSRVCSTNSMIVSKHKLCY